METALQGQEEYEQIERESLRLFRDLHLSDPLFRRMGDRNDGNRPKLTIRRMFGQPSSAGSSSSASVSSFRTLSGASRRSGSSTPAKRVYLTEVPEDPVDEEAPEEEELVEDDEHMVLETAIQKEAQAFAAELEEAEQDGLDPSTIETLEANFESAAETLVTMREARNRLQEIRKDRGYKKPMDGAAKGGQISKKNSKHPCFDCGLPGHWAGDKECQKPGQGLARKAGKVAAAPKQVRFAEVCQSDAIATDPIDTTSTVHEAAMVNVAVGLPLDQALNVNLYGTTHPVLVSDARDIAGDKMLVGALDSACNRTCSGPKWLEAYVQQIRQSAPAFISNLIQEVVEHENFRFGNGGIVPSTHRWRLPAFVGGRVLLLWVSLVPVPSLGLLLGRDFLESVGGVLDFADKTISFKHLEAKTQRLEQMSAGHYMLPLVANTWPRLPEGRWKRCGLDGIIELQLNVKAWFSRCMTDKSNELQTPRKPVSDHMLTEHACWPELVCDDRMPAASLAHSMSVDLQPPVNSRQHHLQGGRHQVLSTECVSDECCIVGQARFERDHSIPEPCGSQVVLRGDRLLRPDLVSMAKVSTSHDGSKGMARAKLVALAAIALILALFAIPLPINRDSRAVAGSGPRPIPSGHNFGQALSHRRIQEPVHFSQSAGVEPISQSSGLALGFRRGSSSGWFAGSAFTPWTSQLLEAGSHSGDQEAGRQGRRESWSCCGSSRADWSSWWPSNAEVRSDQAGTSVGCGDWREGHHSNHQEQGSTDCSRPCHGLSSKCGFRPACTQACCSTKDAEFVSGPTQDSRKRIFDVNAVTSRSCRGQSTVARSTPGGSAAVRREPSHGNGREPNGPFPERLRESHAGHAQPSDATRDGHEQSSDEWCSNTRDHGCKHGGTVSSRDATLNDDFQLPASLKVKPAVRQMISQAWQQHRRDQLAISTNRQRVMEIFNMTWMNEMRQHERQVFSMEVKLPDPFVTEVFTDTEPIAAAARRVGLNAGDSLTLKTGWDFMQPSRREAALSLIAETKPEVVILAFPCGPWSPLHRLNPPADLDEQRAAARELVLFAIKVAELQLRNGRHFLIENPAPSAAWQLDELQTFSFTTRCFVRGSGHVCLQPQISWR